MAYIIIKIVEHLQIIYFCMRAHNGVYHWDYSVISFFSMLLNFISIDQHIISEPTFFHPILLALAVVLLLLVALAALVARFSGWGKKVPTVVKLATSILNYFLYLFKTILIIPIMIIVLVAIVPSITDSLKIPSEGSILRNSLGALVLLVTLFILGYILVLFREWNPFSELPYAG
jgi:hypothetical protein